MKPGLVALYAALLFITSCTSDYSEHAKKVGESRAISASNAIFSVESIPRVDVEIIAGPDSRVFDKISHSIQTAKKRVYVNVYLFTRLDLAKLLSDAHERGVDVRVILEKNVYEMPKVNAKVYSFLKENWILVQWADEQSINFNHAKYALFDDEWLIETANFTASSFEKNREFFMFWKDAPIRDFLEETFESDFSQNPIGSVLTGATIAPIDARSKVTSLLSGAKSSIVFYTESLSDQEIIGILKKKADEWVVVRVCLAKKGKREEKEQLSIFSWSKIAVTQAKKNYVHAKSVLVDHTYLIIGSTNFTANSLDNNREIGLILPNHPFANTFDSLVKKDCAF